MKVLFFCPRWGSEHLSWDVFCQKVKESGYDGVEYAIAAQTTSRELEAAWSSAHKYGLAIIAQHYDTVTSDFDQHAETYQAWLEKIRPYPVVKLNSQTGKDFFNFEQNKALIELGNRYGAIHETHRGKFSFAAHITRQYLEAIPALRLTLDASHWVNVAESLLGDQQEAMSLAISRTDHIHARIGHAEGPQVPDPRMPEWQEALECHLNWWDQVAALKRGWNPPLTITTEFGPFPYMVNQPATGGPIADQWSVNNHLLDLLKQRYA